MSCRNVLAVLQAPPGSSPQAVKPGCEDVEPNAGHRQAERGLGPFGSTCQRLSCAGPKAAAWPAASSQSTSPVRQAGLPAPTDKLDLAPVRSAQRRQPVEVIRGDIRVMFKDAPRQRCLRAMIGVVRSRAGSPAMDHARAACSRRHHVPIEDDQHATPPFRNARKEMIAGSGPVRRRRRQYRHRDGSSREGFPSVSSDFPFTTVIRLPRHADEGAGGTGSNATAFR